MGLKGLSIVNQKIKWANNANNLAEQVDVQHATSNLVVNKYSIQTAAILYCTAQFD